MATDFPSADDQMPFIISDTLRAGGHIRLAKIVEQTWGRRGLAPIHSEASALTQGPRDCGWLIERPADTASGPAWWDGEGFSSESLEAVRFSRQIDAEKVIRFFRDVDGAWAGAGYAGLCATDHEWVPAPEVKE